MALNWIHNSAKSREIVSVESEDRGIGKLWPGGRWLVKTADWETLLCQMGGLRGKDFLSCKGLLAIHEVDILPVDKVVKNSLSIQISGWFWSDQIRPVWLQLGMKDSLQARNSSLTTKKMSMALIQRIRYGGQKVELCFGPRSLDALLPPSHFWNVTDECRSGWSINQVRKFFL